jgi:proline iminopeptidase
MCRSMVLLALVATAIACGGAASPHAPGARASQAGLENGSFTVELNGFPVHYEVHGSGPVLMTIPNSWGLSLEGLRYLYRPLEERLTMVYFDPRGMGGSGAVREEADMGMAAVRADFQALREHLGLERVNAIGWSNGAMNLILLASENPESLSSAIFLHGAASFTAEDSAKFAADNPELVADWSALDRELGTSKLSDEERTRRMKAFWLERYFPAATADPAIAAPLLQRAFADAQFSWAHADYANREAPVFDARDRLGAITARSLVIAGAHDLMPPQKGHELADGIAGAKLALFEHSGHFAPLEEPERFKRVVLEFLGATPAS